MRQIELNATTTRTYSTVARLLKVIETLSILKDTNVRYLVHPVGERFTAVFFFTGDDLSHAPTIARLGFYCVG